MKLLVVKIGAIGDVLMARAMLQAAPRGAEITWLCGRSVTPIVREFAEVSEIIEVDDSALLKGSLLDRVRVMLGIWLSLLGRNYDLVATGHGDKRYGWLSATVRARKRRSFASSPLVPGRQHSDSYAALVHGIEGPAAPQARLLPLRTGSPKSKNALLFPGGARNLLRDDALRRWPLKSYAALAGLLLKKGWKVSVGGAESDRWVLEAFDGLKITSSIGALDLTGTLDACAASSAVVTHDSGPLHMALATPARVIGIFGPTNPAEKVRARPGDAIFWGGEALACRPCYDGKNYAACSDNRCMQTVTPAAVMAAIEGRRAK